MVVFIVVVVDVVALSVGLELVGYVVFVRPTIIAIIDTLNDSFTIHDDGIMLLSSSKRKFADIIELLLIRLFGWLVQVVVVVLGIGIVFTACRRRRIHRRRRCRLSLCT